jgi:hypothetical protein
MVFVNTSQRLGPLGYCAPTATVGRTCETYAMVSNNEIVLAGGNLTTVVRIGDTVRRETGPWTPMVHRLLEHLRKSGFDLAPHVQGIDKLGREILSFIPGDTLTSSPWPSWVWSNQLLEDAVSVLVDYHRKVTDFRPALVESRLGSGTLGTNQIVCHNDFAPYNCVFNDGHISGLIDWDVVCAGEPSWDLAFFAWHWVPLYSPSEEFAWRTLGVSQERLRRIVDSYGLMERSDFVEQIIARIDASRNGILTRANDGDVAFIRLKQAGHCEEMQRTIDFLRANEESLTAALL